MKRIGISINNSISTINSQNIGFWTYTVGLLAAVAIGDVVGLAAVVTIKSVEKQQTCKASSGSQLEGTVSLDPECNQYHFLIRIAELDHDVQI